MVYLKIGYPWVPMNSMGTERQQQRSKTSCTPWDQALFGRKLARSITPRVLRSTQQWKLNQVVAELLQADLMFTFPTLSVGLASIKVDKLA